MGPRCGAAIAIALLAVLGLLQSRAAAPGRGAAPAINIDYPESGSLFPPDMAAPTFLWRDSSQADSWQIDFAFADGSPALHAVSAGERMRVGKIDPAAVSVTNQPPRLTPQQAASHTWKPAPALWDVVKRHSRSAPATITISGSRAGVAASRGQSKLQTSADPVGAPIFYRDVPLMPSETEPGVIKPLAAVALPLVAWRLRDVSKPASRVVMDDIPVCANCHSFSADGKTLGIDLDGLQNNKGMYALAEVKPETSISRTDVIQWSNAQGTLRGAIRVGFMSRVSPDGRYVATTINPAAQGGASAEPPSNYYVANFKQYQFLQVFYPTRGFLEWYSRETGALRPLPGADDPRYVQMGGVWSPDGLSLVFARAEARDPYPPGTPPALFSNDPDELQVQYNLYRIPFRGGAGGVAEPIAGASANGMSNSFPKVSPDGRWIVFVQSRNGLLMRPDSRLFIVRATGGEARLMRCNTPRMNSWHSFSPNGRWLVFSSKARSPYTQMYLTHIDEDGNDSPAILIGDSTAANRAVNLPEFVNIKPDGLLKIGGPEIEYDRLVNRAIYLRKQSRLDESIAVWRKALEVYDGDETAHSDLAAALIQAGRAAEAVAHQDRAAEIRIGKALEAGPASAPLRNELAALLLRIGRAAEAISEARKATEFAPGYAPAHATAGAALAAQGNWAGAEAELRKALALDAASAPAWFQLGLLQAKSGDLDEAIRSWRKALAADPKYPGAHASLGEALYSNGKAAEAITEWRAELEIQPGHAATLRQAAWVLATWPDAAIRDGAEAQAMAVKAVQLTGGRDAASLDALAAAYAERERYGDAAATARRAQAQAESDGNQPQADSIQARASLYEAGNPYRTAKK